MPSWNYAHPASTDCTLTLVDVRNLDSVQKVVVYMAVSTSFNIPQLIFRDGLGSELLHFNLPQPHI